MDDVDSIRTQENARRRLIHVAPEPVFDERALRRRELIREGLDSITLGAYSAARRAWDNEEGSLMMGLREPPSLMERIVWGVKKVVHSRGSYGSDHEGLIRTEPVVQESVQVVPVRSSSALEHVVNADTEEVSDALISESDFDAYIDGPRILAQTYADEAIGGRVLNTEALKAVRGKQERLEAFARHYAAYGDVREAARHVGIRSERTIADYLARTDAGRSTSANNGSPDGFGAMVDPSGEAFAETFEPSHRTPLTEKNRDRSTRTSDWRTKYIIPGMIVGVLAGLFGSVAHDSTVRARAEATLSSGSHHIQVLDPKDMEYAPLPIVDDQKIEATRGSDPRITGPDVGSDAQVRTYNHTVQPGDTLWGILAQQMPVSDVPAAIEAVAEKNGIEPDRIHPGQTLEIPFPETYAVRSGDTLWGIAARYVDAGKVPEAVDVLVQTNGITNPDFIPAGDELDLSGLVRQQEPERSYVDTESVVDRSDAEYTRPSVDEMDDGGLADSTNGTGVPEVVGYERYASIDDTVESIGQRYVDRIVDGRVLNPSAMRAVENKRERLEDFARSYLETGDVHLAARAAGISSQETIAGYVGWIETATRTEGGSDE